MAAKKTEKTRTELDRAAKVAFMQKLQALDADDLDRGLEKMSVEAANLFPMITDRGTDGLVGAGSSANETLLDNTIVKVEADPKDSLSMPSLTLEHQIVINRDGEIVDGRNRTRSVLKRFGLPKIEYVDSDDFVSEVYRATLNAKFKPKTTGEVVDMLKAEIGDETAPEKAWTEADLLFRHVKVVEGGTAAMFDHVLKQNMARRDMTTSQRACVAAQVAVNKARTKRFGMTDNDASIAENFGIGHKTMKRAKALYKSHRDLFQMVLAGQMSVGGAEKEAQTRANTGSGTGGGQSASTTATTVENAHGVSKIVKVNAAGVRDGIASDLNIKEDLFNAIMDGLDKRDDIKATIEQMETLEQVLANVMGVSIK